MPIIKPISDLRNKANSLPELVHKSNEPIFITKNGEGEEVGGDVVHAKIAHHSQCYADEWDTVAGGDQSAGLIFKTVADTPFGFRTGRVAKYTKHRNPLRVRHAEYRRTKSAALTREAAIKSLARSEKLALIATQPTTELYG